jgi:glycine dehydrogenase
MTDFADRHIGPDAAARAHMLAALGFDSLDALIDAAVPRAIREREVLAFGAPKSETEMSRRVAATCAANEVLTSLIGLGYHDTITPPVILRNVLESPPGTPRTRRTSPRSRRVDSKRC